MSGRGRGKRPGGGPGPGRPPKMPHVDQPAPAESHSSGGLVEILAQLEAGKRNEMLALVSRYKAGAISMPEFMTKAREILGDRLYGQLARDMNKAAQAQQAQMAHQMPPIRPPPPTVFTHPQMFAPPPSMLASQYYTPSVAQGFPMPQQQQQQPQHHQPAEIDVTKMDTSSLQDVIQYSGVDLKAEAEALYREHDQPSAYNQNLVDHRMKVDYFFNPLKMRAILQSCLQRQYLNSRTAAVASAAQEKPLGISEEAIQLLGVAIQKRLIGILRRLAELSRHRVDYGRGRFKIKIENDPKKQLWLLEKLFIEGLARKDDQSASAAATNTTINTLPSLQNTKNASSNKDASAKEGKEAAKPATEDLSIKTKLANVTAMAALGIRQKSWMSGASASVESSSGAANAQSSASTDSAKEEATTDQAEAEVHPLSAFYSLPSSTPLSDAELKAQYYSRTISIVDLISCMESDPHLKRSKLLAVLYEALPRENKEYKPVEPRE